MGEMLYARVRDFALRHELIRPGERVLLGLSGGLDSVCLLSLLTEMKEEIPFTLHAAHMNHMLRGADADADEAFVKALCDASGIPCHTKRVDVPKTARETGESTEAAGRRVRYAFFRSLLSDKIAVAHHRGDQAETVLMHLLRGSGAEGLSGMAPVEGEIIRPLLEVSREELFAYANEKALTWREDATNGEDEYLRNRLRHHVMPLLIKENPKAEEHIAACADKIREDHAALSFWAEDFVAANVTADEGAVTCACDALRGLPRAVRMRILRHMAGEDAFLGEIHLLAMEKLLSAASGARVSLPGGKIAEREYDTLRVGDVREECVPYRIEVTGAGEYPLPFGAVLCVAREGEGIRIPKGAIHGTLIARSRASGDTFVPAGSNFHKKVKDWFIDRKIPRREREAAVILSDDTGILAVLPYVRDARAACTQGEEWVVTVKK